MKYVVAVSGGVDSVVLLDVLAREHGNDIVVAHFDHGIRSESADDARFVRALAKKYGAPSETERVELGSGASEDAARTGRYEFLKRIAQKHEAKLVTAHHRDDVVETVMINLTRGTGWRGLAVLNDRSIGRPLRSWTKREIYTYALRHGLEWVEDETNRSNDYLRNRVRRRVSLLSSDSKHEIAELADRQRALAMAIDDEAGKLSTSSRYFMTMIDSVSAIEILRAVLLQTEHSLTRPQRQAVLHGIKTARPGSALEAGQDVRVEFTTREFIVKHP